MLVLIVMIKWFRFHKFICMQYKIKAFTIWSLSCTNVVMLILILLLLLSDINPTPVSTGRLHFDYMSSLEYFIGLSIRSTSLYLPCNTNFTFIDFYETLSLSLKSVHLLHLTIVLRFMILLILSATHIK